MAKLNREAIAVHVLTCSTYEEAFQKSQGYALAAVERLKEVIDNPRATNSARVTA